MKFESKYNIGDLVYFLSLDKTSKGKVSLREGGVVEINIKQMAFSVSPIQLFPSPYCGIKEVEYEVHDKITCETFILGEGNLYKHPKELFKSIAESSNKNIKIKLSD